MTNPTDLASQYRIPADRYYESQHHMWAKPIAGSKRVVVGIDALGLAAMGDLAYVAFRQVGTEVTRADSFGTLEAAKMTGDLYSPISGKIIEVNADVLKKPSIVNDDPYEKGWLVIIEATDWENESRSLISGDKLPNWIARETERYRNQGWIR